MSHEVMHGATPVDRSRQVNRVVLPLTDGYFPLPPPSPSPVCLSAYLPAYSSQPVSHVQPLFSESPGGGNSWLGADIGGSVADGVVTSQGTADMWLFGDVS